MSASAPKTRNARAPRTKAKAAAPEKTAPTVPPVHTRWSTAIALLLKGEEVELSPERREAWEWFRSKTADPKVNMTNRTVGVLVAGHILFEHGGILKAVRKGGRK